MTLPSALLLDLTAWGTARATPAEAAAMRKELPAWVPPGTPGHFLKHADEQTIVAVAALDDAIRRGELQLADLRQRLVIAAPRYMGRIAGAAALDRYGRGGGPALSPHLIPQHSLHSVSGALSILLASRQPNLGVGGGDDSLMEGLLAALTLPGSDQASGVLLVATAWMPEPVVDRQANCTNEPTCFAVALALQPAGASGCSLGTLQFHSKQLHATPAGPLHGAGRRETSPVNVPQLCNCLEALASGYGRGVLHWAMPGGQALELQVNAAARRMVAA